MCHAAAAFLAELLKNSLATVLVQTLRNRRAALAMLFRESRVFLVLVGNRRVLLVVVGNRRVVLVVVLRITRDDFRHFRRVVADVGRFIDGQS